MLQQIIAQSGTLNKAVEETLDNSWTAALDGNYTDLPDVTISEIFTPTTTEVNTYNHHIQSYKYYDALHVIFSTHEKDEKGAGSRIRYSKSTDNGLTWATPLELLQAQDDSAKDFETVIVRQSIACGFAEYNNELYAIISVDELDPTPPLGNAPRTGVGILAVKINSNATFGTPVWIDTPQSDFVAPLAVPTYPSYSFDTSLRSGLREFIIKNQYISDQISYFATSENDPLYTRKDFSGNTMAEPSVSKLPDGGYIKLWKDGDTSGTDYKVAQTSDNQITWNTPFITTIPDVNARTRIKLLNSNEIAIIGNNQGSNRDPLYLALSTDLDFTTGNVYNIYVTTYPAQFSGEGKGRGAQHPTQIFELDNGKIFICFNVNKEEVYCATFDKPTLI